MPARRAAPLGPRTPRSVQWWTQDDDEEFQKRAKCLVDECLKFEAVAGLQVNGELTPGKNAADLGGLLLAFFALMDVLRKTEFTVVDGYTPAQRFFLGYGQAWCREQAEEGKAISLRACHFAGESSGAICRLPAVFEAGLANIE